MTNKPRNQLTPDFPLNLSKDIDGVISAVDVIKLFVDDVRDPPDDSWYVVRTASEALRVLATGVVHELSLDHDLGDDKDGTGYTIICCLEEWAADNQWQKVPERIVVHSANPVGRKNIEAGIASINHMRKRRV